MTIKKIVNLAIIAGLVLTLLILYLNTEVSMKNTPARQMSGTFTVSAGKGPEETKIWVSRKEVVWLSAEPKTKLFDAKSGRAIEIGPDGWTSPPITKKGHLTFLKGPEAIQVNYSIIN